MTEVVMSVDQHERLVRALLRSLAATHGGVRRLDTHISTVVLAGELAYKIKKPLNLGFLDFESLDDRRHACSEEIRLNRRLAPRVYRRFVPITGTIDRPLLGGSGTPIDWTVEMVRFDADAVLSMHPDWLNEDMVREFGRIIAAFHDRAAVCDTASSFGRPDVVVQPMRQNFAQIRERQSQDDQRLRVLDRWTETRFAALASHLQKRRESGRVRECHGDLHLGNIALLDGEPLVFDAIEFNPSFNWIDVFNDLAFLTMDLRRIGRADLAQVFIDSYLQHSGDFDGLALLRFYEVYRALVRAKIAAIRQSQQDTTADEGAQARREYEKYVDLAGRISRPGSTAIIIMHGVSGSGKSTVAASLVKEIAAVRVRSDVERKRLVSQQGAGADQTYSRELTAKTYQRMFVVGRQIVASGFAAVLDATFLQAEWREQARALAAELSVPFLIVHCEADPAELERRILERGGQTGNVSDADAAVMRAQMNRQEDLSAAELAHSLPVAPDRPLAIDKVIAAIA